MKKQTNYHSMFYKKAVSIILSCETFEQLENCSVFLSFDFAPSEKFALVTVMEIKLQNLSLIPFEEAKKIHNQMLIKYKNMFNYKIKLKPMSAYGNHLVDAFNYSLQIFDMSDKKIFY